MCMSRGTHVNESWHTSWHTCECVISHMWMSHGTHVNESCRKYQWEIHTNRCKVSCQIVSYTATRCSTLQRTCNTIATQLQHTRNTTSGKWAVESFGTMQRTATHCNTLQRTCNTTATQPQHNKWHMSCRIICCSATHCNTVHCNTLLHTASHCTATHCYILLHTATRCNALQHITTHCNMPDRNCNTW